MAKNLKALSNKKFWEIYFHSPILLRFLQFATNLFEKDFWQKPSDSFGINYWLVKKKKKSKKIQYKAITPEEIKDLITITSEVFPKAFEKLNKRWQKILKR